MSRHDVLTPVVTPQEDEEKPITPEPSQEDVPDVSFSPDHFADQLNEQNIFQLGGVYYEYNVPSNVFQNILFAQISVLQFPPQEPAKPEVLDATTQYQ